VETFIDDVVLGRANLEGRVVSQPRKYFRRHFAGADNPIMVFAGKFNDVTKLTGTQDNKRPLHELTGGQSRITHQGKAIGVKECMTACGLGRDPRAHVVIQELLQQVKACTPNVALEVGRPR